MLYMVFKGKIVSDKVEEFYEKVAKPAQKVTHERDRAVAYQWHRDEADPTRFFLYEMWNNVEDLHSHFDTLYEVFGPAKPTERLPASILGYLEEADVAFYEAIEG